jgi:hypothetical protein
MHASEWDHDYFKKHTPNIPYYVISANGRIDGQIYRPEKIYPERV